MPKRRTVSAELVRVVAEASRFPSPEPKAASPANAAPLARRPPRIHRAGRTMQFNARTTPQTVKALYAIADQQGWLVGETSTLWPRRGGSWQGRAYGNPGGREGED
jgi:hypothetical protein